MPKTELCKAIKSKSKIKLYYSYDKEPGFRIVEPHMVAYNEAGNIVLSAWYLSGASESHDGPGWREYLLSGISSVTILPENFPGPQKGYNPTGGKKFHNVQCGL
jgi:hypothetical protein